MSTTATVAGHQPRAAGSLQDYILLEEIGRGAHGVVYRAHPRANPSDTVAIKIVADNSSIDRLLLEPQLLSRLHHPNIVSLRDYFLDGGRVVLVTEFIDGPDLFTWTERRGRCTPAEVRDFLTQMAAAVSHAHAADIIHSDIKPKNILVDTSRGAPRFVIVDFGVSRIAGGIQRSSYLAGTCAYMAPEQLRGRGAAQSDLWALGVLAYMLLTGSLPFPGRTLEELRKEIQYDQPAFLVGLAQDDPLIERVILRLLEKNPVDRMPTAADLMKELATRVSSPPNERRSTVEGSTPAWESHLETEVRNFRQSVIICALIGSLPEIIPGILACLGVWVIFRGQVLRRYSLAAAGLAVIAIAVVVGGVMGAIEERIYPGTSNAFSFAGFAFGLCDLGAAYYFVRWRKVQRELTLLQSLRADNREQALNVLRQYVSSTPGDMNIRRRYIDALLVAGHTAEAAVEARLALDIDPYNLPATLLLANAYLELGLVERCEQVCNGYLEVAPQCFEFEELRSTVLKRAKAAA